MLVEIIEHEFKQGYYNVYKCYNEKQKLFESRPYCLISFEDFYNLLNEHQNSRLENDMEYQFRVNVKDLIINCEKIY